MAFIFLRCFVVLLCAIAGAALTPLPSGTLPPGGALILNGLFGLALGAAAVSAEVWLRGVPFRRIAGGITGLVAGEALAQVLMRALPPGLRFASSPVDFQMASPLLHFSLMAAGALLGAHKGSNFKPDRLVQLFRTGKDHGSCKLLDTSVIIDGRIADICETGFLDGTLVVPQFVLRELQQVADSSDTLKRNRGRKGLDILQRIKKCAAVNVVIPEADFPDTRDVDHKLIELALHMAAKIVTNDFNLNKVAQLRGVEVLNINDLANSLKPVVLPGETMKVFILKEGKEPNQGVAYLDDGTMVVVDNARKHLGTTVEIMVTSVLQTTAGKMFFGRCALDNEKGVRRREGSREAAQTSATGRTEGDVPEA